MRRSGKTQESREDERVFLEHNVSEILFWGVKHGWQLDKTFVVQGVGCWICTSAALMVSCNPVRHCHLHSDHCGASAWRSP